MVDTARKNKLLVTSALAWIHEQGVDDICTDEPLSWIRRSAFKAPDQTEKVVQLDPIRFQKTQEKESFVASDISPSISPTDVQAPPIETEQYDVLPTTHKKLIAEWEQLDIPAARTAMHFVAPVMKTKAKILIIGETPSAEEDQMGEIYAVGDRTTLLKNMLNAIAMPWDDCAFAYLIPWRPPGNREPSLAEVKASLPYLLRFIEMVKPQSILLLGGIVGRALLGKEEAISKLIGPCYSFSEAQISTYVIHNLQTLLATPFYKKQAWQTLLKLSQPLKAEKK